MLSKNIYSVVQDKHFVLKCYDRWLQHQPNKFCTN